ncbi:MAG TPA: NADH-quinone oxidoreductase subunit J [Gemmatimonadales bacterium]|nr:NADH-quinone oxidoreductase subunit J [Gemmatimonadales bacterium]
MSAELVFYILGAGAVIAALGCITQKNPVASAVWLVGALFALAGIYILLNAQFIGIIQVLVYAGAIMVLFLFVIMLLNLSQNQNDIRPWPMWLAGLGILAAISVPLFTLGDYSATRLAAEVTGAAVYGDPAVALPAGQAAARATEELGVVGAIAGPLFKSYLVPFEITSILLLAAAVGAVVVAKRKL